MSHPYRPDVVLSSACVVERPETIERINALLAEAGLGRPLSAPVTRAGTPTELVELPVDGDPVVVCEVTRRLAGRTDADLPVMIPDFECTAATVEEHARRQDLYPRYQASGRKSGHGTVAWLPAPDYAMPPRPDRRPASVFPMGRPVVALLDTGVKEHDWLTAADSEPYWTEAQGWTPRRAIPESGGADFGSHWGHGTFLAGLLRLGAPDAEILLLRVMSDAGKVSDVNLVHALNWLADRLDGGQRVDVVLTAFGRPKGDDGEDMAPVRAALARLAARGVPVVASAGNNGTETPVYPAAFAVDPALTVVSVGACDSPTTRAPYSNHGVWVRQWCEGTNAVSTMPLTTAVTDQGGYAYWTGTSFAAARHAATLAQRMVTAPGQP